MIDVVDGEVPLPGLESQYTLKRNSYMELPCYDVFQTTVFEARTFAAAEAHGCDCSPYATGGDDGATGAGPSFP